MHPARCSLGAMDPVTIILAVGLVLACAAAPITAYVIVRHIPVGGTTEEIARLEHALAVEKAKNEQDLAERRLALEEKRVDQELVERTAKLDALQFARAQVRNVERG